MLDFPEQLTSDNISISFTRDNRTEFAGHFLLNISWERPEGMFSSVVLDGNVECDENNFCYRL